MVGSAFQTGLIYSRHGLSKSDSTAHPAYRDLHYIFRRQLHLALVTVTNFHNAYYANLHLDMCSKLHIQRDAWAAFVGCYSVILFLQSI